MEMTHLFIRTEVPGVEWISLSLEDELMRICRYHNISADPWTYNGKDGVRMDASAKRIFRGEEID
jgi:hypothetical protein